LTLSNNDKSEEITLPLTFEPLPKLEFRINNEPFNAVFDTGAAYVIIGALDTARAVNIERFTPSWTNGTDTFYKDVPLTLPHVGTVKTNVLVAMHSNCIPPYVFFDTHCVKFSDKAVSFKPKNNVISNQFISYVNVEHKTDRKKLRLPAFKFSINYSVFDALFDTGSAWNIISHKTAEEIDIKQFEKLPDPLSSDMEGKVLFDGYSCEVVLADSCKVATHMDVYIGDLTKPTQRLEYSSVPNVISAIDYLKKGWSVTFCKHGAGFRRD
jgi:hypothetical protein